MPVEQRKVLHGVSWQRYERLLRRFDHRHLRWTYDHGTLEVTTRSSERECWKRLLGRQVEILLELLGGDAAGRGSLNLRRRKYQCGLEPDECYWIQNEPLIRGKKQIHLRHDPPPDLVLEIQATPCVVNRLSIYAALRVPEVWEYDGRWITVQRLETDARYAIHSTSRVFPFVPMAELPRFLNLRSTLSHSAVSREFRAWVQQQIAAGWPTP